MPPIIDYYTPTLLIFIFFIAIANIYLPLFSLPCRCRCAIQDYCRAFIFCWWWLLIILPFFTPRRRLFFDAARLEHAACRRRHKAAALPFAIDAKDADCWLRHAAIDTHMIRLFIAVTLMLIIYRWFSFTTSHRQRSFLRRHYFRQWEFLFTPMPDIFDYAFLHFHARCLLSFDIFLFIFPFFFLLRHFLRCHTDDISSTRPIDILFFSWGDRLHRVITPSFLSPFFTIGNFIFFVGIVCSTISSSHYFPSSFSI